MDRHNLIALVGLTFLPLLGGSVEAQYCPVTIKATSLTNQPYVTTNNITSQAAPLKGSVTNKTVLDDLAEAETLAGAYTGPVPFPSGSKLAVHVSFGVLDFFVVVDKNNNQLVPVDNIMSFAFTNDIMASSGSRGPDSAFDLGLMGEFSITYNQAGIPGATTKAWHITGFLTQKEVGKENSNMDVAVTSMASMPHAQGNGVNAVGNYALSNASFSYFGKGGNQ